MADGTSTTLNLGAMGSATSVDLRIAGVVAREIAFSAIKASSWDAFAAACASSARSTRAHMWGWNVKNWRTHRLRTFEILTTASGQEAKIGQCAVGVCRGQTFQFLDRLQILPDFEDHWDVAMAAVLSAVGPGTYEYGWELNLEPPRNPELARIRGVKINTSKDIVVQAIDFSKWDSWIEYYIGMRRGARQSAKVAFRDLPDLTFVTRSGFGTLLSIYSLIDLRLGISRRKRLGLRFSELAQSYLGWMIFCPHLTYLRMALSKNSVLSIFYGLEFGEHTYFLEGASIQGNKGASWAVLISIIERAYARTPLGKFVMGYVDYSIHDEALGGGLIQSRTACRVTDYPTSIISFRFSANGNSL